MSFFFLAGCWTTCKPRRYFSGRASFAGAAVYPRPQGLESAGGGSAAEGSTILLTNDVIIV